MVLMTATSAAAGPRDERLDREDAIEEIPDAFFEQQDRLTREDLRNAEVRTFDVSAPTGSAVEVVVDWQERTVDWRPSGDAGVSVPMHRAAGQANGCLISQNLVVGWATTPVGSTASPTAAQTNSDCSSAEVHDGGIGRSTITCALNGICLSAGIAESGWEFYVIICLGQDTAAVDWVTGQGIGVVGRCFLFEFGDPASWDSYVSAGVMFGSPVAFTNSGR